MGKELPAEAKMNNSEYKSKKYDDWEVKNFARTLTEAEEIKADKEKMALAKKCLASQYEALGKVKMSLDDLKAKGNNMPMDYEEEEEEEEKEEKEEKEVKKG